MKQHEYSVYILASKSGTLYIGVTNNLMRRVLEHRAGKIPGFTKEYGCAKLVYLEDTDDVASAIEREKQLKKWRREKKENLIKTINPQWKDLSEGWYDEWSEAPDYSDHPSFRATLQSGGVEESLASLPVIPTNAEESLVPKNNSRDLSAMLEMTRPVIPTEVEESLAPLIEMTKI